MVTEHPSIKLIKGNYLDLSAFKIPLAELKDIDIILKDLNVKKSPGPDLLPPKLINENYETVETGSPGSIFRRDFAEYKFSCSLPPEGGGGVVKKICPLISIKLKNCSRFFSLQTFAVDYYRR